MTASFQRRDALFTADLSGIARKMQHSIQSDMSLFSQQQDMTINTSQLENATSQLWEVVERIKEKQKLLEVENKALTKRLKDANTSSLQGSIRDPSSTSLSHNGTNETPLERCIRYKNKYH
jgi:regulator of replication initiation timing